MHVDAQPTYLCRTSISLQKRNESFSQVLERELDNRFADLSGDEQRVKRKQTKSFYGSRWSESRRWRLTSHREGSQ